MLARLLFPERGKVLFDGMDMLDISGEEYRKKVAYMPQHPIIFEGSIRDNVTLGYGADDEDVHKCLARAGLVEFIDSLGEGIHAQIGSRCRNMSEGEKQRLCLARTLMRKPKIVLLDEPTSHLDDNNVKIIYESLNKYREDENATIIIISHNVNINECSDELMDLDLLRIKDNEEG
jgi:ABC-type multidrug transport system fused ATPase/permease subunit